MTNTNFPALIHLRDTTTSDSRRGLAAGTDVPPARSS